MMLPVAFCRIRKPARWQVSVWQMETMYYEVPRGAGAKGRGRFEVGEMECKQRGSLVNVPSVEPVR